MTTPVPTNSTTPRRLFSVPAFHFDMLPKIGGWSKLATRGIKAKDGAVMEFNNDSMGQMISNFAARGDVLAICQDHLSAYVSQTGRPAPAMGFFSALALFEDGALVKHHAVDGSEPPDGIDDKGNKRDGLFARLAEITPLGADPKEGFPAFKFLSPMFLEAAEAEDGSPIGFALVDAACTNTPFQSGTEIAFHSLTRPDSAPVTMAQWWAVQIDSGHGFVEQSAHRSKETAEAQAERWRRGYDSRFKPMPARVVEGSQRGYGDAPGGEKMSALTFSLPGWPGAVVCAECNRWMSPEPSGTLPPHGDATGAAPCAGSLTRRFGKRYCAPAADVADPQAMSATHAPAPIDDLAVAQSMAGADAQSLALRVGDRVRVDNLGGGGPAEAIIAQTPTGVGKVVIEVATGPFRGNTTSVEPGRITKMSADAAKVQTMNANQSPAAPVKMQSANASCEVCGKRLGTGRALNLSPNPEPPGDRWWHESCYRSANVPVGTRFYKRSPPQMSAMSRCPGCSAPTPTIAGKVAKHVNMARGVTCAGTGAVVRMAVDPSEVQRAKEAALAASQEAGRLYQEWESGGGESARLKWQDADDRKRAADRKWDDLLRQQAAENNAKANANLRKVERRAGPGTRYSSAVATCPHCHAAAPVAMSAIAKHVNPRTRVVCAGVGQKVK